MSAGASWTVAATRGSMVTAPSLRLTLFYSGDRSFGHPAEFTACTAPLGKLSPDSVTDCSQSASEKSR